MPPTLKTIRFPSNVSLGSLYLIDANNLLDGYKPTLELATTRIQLGQARGVRNLYVPDNCRLLLEINQRTFNMDNVMQGEFKPGDIDIVSGIRDDEPVWVIIKQMPWIRGLIFGWGAKISSSALDCINRSLGQLEYLVLTNMVNWETSFLIPSRFSGLTNLRTLVCSSYPSAELARALTQIEQLSIGHPKNGTFCENLKALSEFPALKSLSIIGTSIPDDGLEALGNLKTLEELDLHLTSSRPNIRTLNWSNLRALRKLNISSMRLNDDDLAFLSDLPQLEELDATSNPLTDKASEHLTGLKNLRKLSWSNMASGQPPFSEISLLNIGMLDSIISLSIRGARLTKAGLAALTKLHKLKELILSSTHIADDDMVSLLNFKELKKLDLSHNSQSITGRGLMHLASLPLEELSLSYCDLFKLNKGLEHLSQIKTLRRLDLSQNPLSGSELEYIGKLTELESLDLSYPKFNQLEGQALKMLLPLTRLKCLNLSNTRIDDSIIPIIQKFTSLVKLRARDSRISDRGLEYLKDVID